MNRRRFEIELILKFQIHIQLLNTYVSMCLCGELKK